MKPGTKWIFYHTGDERTAVGTGTVVSVDPSEPSKPIVKVKAVAAKADLRLIGIGQMDQLAQVHVDGFVSREELLEMMRLGANAYFHKPLSYDEFLQIGEVMKGLLPSR